MLLTSYGGRKLFCKEPCEQVDMLIETSGATAQRWQNNRYSIDYKQRELFVSITQLTKSDSGKYWCGAGTYKNIEIIVVDAKLVVGPSAEKTINAGTGGNIVVECSFTRSGTEMFFCKEECERDILVGPTYKDLKKGRYSIRYLEASKEGFVIVSIEQLTQSDSGWYRCGLGRTSSKDPYQRFRLIVTDGEFLLDKEKVARKALTTSTPPSSVPSASTETSNQSESSTSSPASPKTTEHPESTTTTGRGFVKPKVRNQNLVWKHKTLLHRRLKTTRVNPPTLRSNLSTWAHPTAVSTVTLSVLSTLFLGWKLALMSPLCALLLTTPNNSHSLAEEAGVD
nr:fas apoptotic inhibitory molecule 3-like isoform X3 [Pseudochaenichthys georgianus]